MVMKESPVYFVVGLGSPYGKDRLVEMVSNERDLAEVICRVMFIHNTFILQNDRVEMKADIDCNAEKIRKRTG